MIIKRLYPEHPQELIDKLADQLQGARCVVIQAGHFLLYYDHTEARLLPGIADALDGPRHALVAQEIGHYPLLTWQLAIPMLAAVTIPRKLAMVVVNDWQYVPKEVDRFNFYRQYPVLPKTYQALLDQYPEIQLLRPRQASGSRTGDYFSEQTLRNAYERHVKELIKNDRRDESCCNHPYLERRK